MVMMVWVCKETATGSKCIVCKLKKPLCIRTALKFDPAVQNPIKLTQDSRAFWFQLFVFDIFMVRFFVLTLFIVEFWAGLIWLNCTIFKKWKTFLFRQKLLLRIAFNPMLLALTGFRTTRIILLAQVSTSDWLTAD